jgi:hypothetical protein
MRPAALNDSLLWIFRRCIILGQRGRFGASLDQQDIMSCVCESPRSKTSTHPSSDDGDVPEPIFIL